MRLLPWLANPGNPAMNPHAEGHPPHWYKIYSGNKGGLGGGGGEASQKLCSKAQRRYNERIRDPRACGQQETADCTGLPMLAPSMHWRRCTNELSKTQGNAEPWRLHWRKCLTKHLWARKERWHSRMNWCVCLTVPWTLKGKQTLFVFNSIKLHLTAFIEHLIVSIWLEGM